MPLRDHFHPPLDKLRHWEGLHATWPVMMVAALRRILPRRYYAEPHVHLGVSAEIDIATFEGDITPLGGEPGTNGGGLATAVWAPMRPTFDAATDLPKQDVYEVRVYDEQMRSRLVAAVELVSPRNKDRTESRQAFTAKCAAMLKERVSVSIVDVVTVRSSNLYAELLAFIGHDDPAIRPHAPDLYATACRLTKADEKWRLQSWVEALEMGRPLPTIPLWLADNLAVPLELESTYEQSCNIIGIT
jgi:hypothetical protein